MNGQAVCGTRCRGALQPSDIGTKFYNKTLELIRPSQCLHQTVHRKHGRPLDLIDNATNVTKTKPDGTTYTPEIWRIEFSIRSSVKNWFLIHLDGDEHRKQSIRNTLDMYDTREKLIVLFASLQQHYFRFKHLLKRYKFYAEGHSDGYAVRKDLCP